MVFRMFLCFLLLANYQEPWTPWKKGDARFSKLVGLVISFSKNNYYIREPLKLNIALINKSNRVVTGHLSSEFESGKFKLYYRYKNESYVKFNSAKEELAKSISLIIPKTLNPQEVFRNREWIVFDVYKEKFVLEKLGNYEFKAIYKEDGDDNLVKSNTLTIKVVLPPAKEKKVLEIYNEETIARLIQGNKPFSREKGLNATKQLAFLLENYPNSVYTKYFRRGLARGKSYWDPSLQKDNKHPYEELLTFPKTSENINNDEIDVTANKPVLEGLEDTDD